MLQPCEIGHYRRVGLAVALYSREKHNIVSDREFT